MIVLPHTIVDPRTMMIVSVNAFIADIAVSRSFCSDYLTIWAYFCKVVIDF
jgi:hypothetical protein